MPSLAISLAQSLAQSLGSSIGNGDWEFSNFTVFANASERYVINPETGVITGPFASGIPAVIWIDGKRYLQVEASDQNVPTYTNDLTNGVWGKVDASDSISAIADPQGNTTAYRYIPSTTSGEHFLYQAKTYRTIQVIAKNAGYNYLYSRASISGYKMFTFNLTTGSIYAADISVVTSSRSISLGNDWWYFEVILNADSLQYTVGAYDNSTGSNFAGDGSSGVDIWLPQGKTNTKYGTSLIETESSAVTRAKDQVYIPALSLPFFIKDKSKWIRYPKWSSAQVTTGDEREICEFEDTTQNIRCYYDGSDKKVKVAGRIYNLVSGNQNWGVWIINGICYYTEAGTNTIKSVPVTGGTPTTLVTGVAGLRDLCCTSTKIYYLTASGLNSVDITGGTGSLIVSDANNPQTCFTDGTKVYYASYNDGKIKSYTIIGGATNDEVTGLTNPVGVSASATDLWWSANGKISYRPLAGGATTDFITGLTSVQDIYVDEDSGIVCYVANDVIYYAPIATGVSVQILDAQTTARGICCDATCVYIGVYGLNKVNKIFKAPFSSAATTHSANQKLEVTLDRIAGSITLANFTTGNGETVGTPWNRTDGDLKIGQDSSEANQIDGVIRLEKTT